MQDADAVRRRWAPTQVNLVGGSYGTRAALEYLRQFPQARAPRRDRRRGAARHGAAGRLLAPTTRRRCDALFARLRSRAGLPRALPARCARDWRALLAQPAARGDACAHPVTGATQRLTLDARHRCWAWCARRCTCRRWPSALPLAHRPRPRAGRFDAAGRAGRGAVGRRARAALAEGMHFSVVCAEDVPRLAQAADRPGADFGDAFADLYRQRLRRLAARRACRRPSTRCRRRRRPMLVLSGGADPVTPPRHGERVAQALGAKARHVVVPQAGHGVMGLGCMRDAAVPLHRRRPTTPTALAVDADCARAHAAAAGLRAASPRRGRRDDRSAASCASASRRAAARKARTRAGRGRRQLHRRRRPHHRPAGAQRRRQDDHAAHRRRR